jgi:hypothetical protein
VTGGKLPAGWSISPRLMACWTFRDGSTIEVAPPAYRLALADGTPVEESVDFIPAGRGWADVLGEFVEFLQHYATGCDHDDACPFSPGWHEWCASHDQELEDLPNGIYIGRDWADVLEGLVYAGGCDHDDDCPFSLQPDETEGD